MATPIIDDEYEEVSISKVEPEKDGWSLTRADGRLFFCPANESGIVPAVGDTARFYGKGIGRPVRGLAINNRVVFYEAKEEYQERMKKHFADEKAKRRKWYDATAERRQKGIDALPAEFQSRLARFHRNSPDFWDHEEYELMCCKDAVAIAKTLGDAAKIKAFHDLDWKDQKALVPDMSEGHSGNSFGAACRLAWLYLSQPDLIDKDHGALCPLVECKDYGCYVLEITQ